MPASLPLSVSSPTDGSSINTSTVTVTGTTAPGARVDAEAAAATGGAAATASTTADSSGNWSLVLPVSFGTTKITLSATLGNSTGYDQLSVIDVALPGTSVLDVTDPTGDDNGPGTYAYPTSGDFKPGAFDLTAFRVNQTATDVYIQAKIRNLAPTFGNSFGAQLLDVYVRDPAASVTSASAPFPSRNYAIAAPDAWSERIEVQGFAAPVWVNASGAPLGALQMVVDQASGTVTLILPRASFGTVGSNWVFTLALTGQDGFSADQARGFAPTPQSFLFGVCAPGGTSPICAVDTGTVPKVLDTITPAGVSQSAELDPTLGQVTLHGVTVP
jgi:glucoamylase